MIHRKILNTVSSLLNGASKIIVACSGGADSIALLHALLMLREDLGITVAAAHFNHLIRGEEAERDERFVREFCAEYQVELFCGSADVPLYAKEQKIGMELAARKLRYEFLESLEKDALIATAHTASDNLETVLLNLTRGTGLDGLCGIPLKRGSFIRPLLYCTRDEIEKYCADNNLPFVTDSTNLSDEYTRNRIRHTIVPELKKINPAVESAVARTTRNLREERELAVLAAKDFFDAAICDGRLCIKGLDTLSVSVAKRVLKLYCDNFCFDADAFHLDGLYECCKTHKTFSMPNNLSAVVSNGFLELVQNGKKEKVNFSVEMKEENTDFSKTTQKIHNLLLNNAIDCDKIIGKPYVRTRDAGDKFKLRDTCGTKTLKKLYNEYKIPLSERENLPLICDDEGIIWIYRIGAAQRVAVDRSTRKIINITVKKQEV